MFCQVTSLCHALSSLLCSCSAPKPGSLAIDWLLMYVYTCVYKLLRPWLLGSCPEELAVFGANLLIHAAVFITLQFPLIVRGPIYHGPIHQRHSQAAEMYACVSDRSALRIFIVMQPTVIWLGHLAAGLCPQAQAIPTKSTNTTLSQQTSMSTMQGLGQASLRLHANLPYIQTCSCTESCTRPATCQVCNYTRLTLKQGRLNNQSSLTHAGN